MSELTIWDRLAKLDGMCEHDWDDGRPDRYFSRSKRFTCLKCGYQAIACKREDLAPVGDGWGTGRNEERFNSIETLLRLAADLGLTVQLTHFARGGLGRCLAKAWPQGKQGEGARVRDTLATVALATAILKAMEVAGSEHMGGCALS